MTTAATSKIETDPRLDPRIKAYFGNIPTPASGGLTATTAGHGTTV
jgi:hypothetical protein